MARDKQAEKDRKAKLDRMRAEQQRADRRRTLLMAGGVAVLIVALIGGVSWVVVGEQRQQAAAEAELNKPIDGLQEVKDLARDHTQDPVGYPQNPPVGGNHNPVWADCGVWTKPVPNENGVHSLEHGAVWITYRPDLAPAELEALKKVAADNAYVLLSPYPDLPAPVVASAWGFQVTLDSATDPRLARFLNAYLQGPQTPEPGAACTGGVPAV